jgi:hypothetical protein
MQGFRAIALHHLPIVCRSSGTSILEYIGKYFKFRIEKKTGNLGCFVCPLPVFFSLNCQPFLATLPQGVALSHICLTLSGLSIVNGQQSTVQSKRAAFNSKQLT